MDAGTNSTQVSLRWLVFMNRSPATIAVETSILLLIVLIAIGGNLLVVISIYRNPSLRIITNYLALSLAITDILHLIMAMPLTIIASVQSRFDFNPHMCDFQAISVISLVYITVINMVLMAVNRFVRVCKPEKYQKLFNKKTTSIMIVIAWVTIFVGTTVYNKLSNSASNAIFFPEQMRCNFVYDTNKQLFVVLGNMLIVACLLIPFIIITYCYFKVFKKIRKHKRSIADSTSTNSSGLGKSVREIKITWTLFAVLLGYCVTWIPALLVTLVTNIFGWSFLSRQVHLIVTFSGLSSSALNPVIYGLMNPSFRQEYAKIFGCK
ncbi:octopamine receptor beta-2R-like [Actinia tenebrosa]|uniref:Octopamine receptor beta-2R-like n=1 Tax=Actinia tenebrosa TaxID=6105 RepID=A0A6P8H0H4_ACTTE|nr:octopamine receptor beta-2R-like [Actinia tenebrosa]